MSRVDVEQYIANRDPAVEPIWRALREMVEAAVPGVECELFAEGHVIYCRLGPTSADIVCSLAKAGRARAVSLGFQNADELADPSQLLTPMGDGGYRRLRVTSPQQALSEPVRALVLAAYARHVR